MATRQEWGRALQGMGAWWSGKGPEWEAAEQERRRQAMIDDTMVMASLVESGNRGDLLRFVNDRRDAIIGLGGSTDHTDRIMQGLMSSNPQEVQAAEMDILRARNVLAGPQSAPQMQKGQSTIMRNPDGTFVSVMSTFDPGSGEQVMQVTPIEGVDGSSPVMTNSMGLTPDEAVVFAGEEAGAKEKGKLDTQLKLLPEVKAAVTAATKKAESLAVIAEENRTNQKSWDVFNVSMGNLAEALGGTSTGPFLGWLPAITANQQISDGAIAAMAPVLKNLFRSAGEGNFTDQDQQLLMAMVPSRTDKPEARAVKIKFIAETVAAKLGIEATSENDPLGILSK